MRTCPKCHKNNPDDAAFCAHDGTPLLPASDTFERTLAANLGRRYRIIQRLATGGMGSVYLAEQIAVGHRPVALKVLLRKLLDDPEFLSRFHNEAASTGRIHHPNVVTIYESGQADDGTPYIAMEYLEGKTLRHVLQANGSLPVADCVEITQQVARGLQAAHKLGIIHRDLKPDNIFLIYGDEGELVVKVVDFGIARLLDSATKTLTGVMLGTPAYISAEQANGMHSDELDARSDVYSLGIVTYEMLTGRLPFNSDTPLGYVRKHMLEDPPPLNLVRPDLQLTQELEKVMRKVLHKDRNQRYSSAMEFAREFAEAIRLSLPARIVERFPQVLEAQALSVASEVRGVRPFPSSSAGATEIGVETPLPMTAEDSQEPVEEVTPVMKPVSPAAHRPLPPQIKPSQPPIDSTTRPHLVSGIPGIILVATVAIFLVLVILAVSKSFRWRMQGARAGMVYIPGGTFKMGRDNGPDPAEGPPHLVTVAPFYLDKTPVTNAQYAEFVRATGRPAPSAWTGPSYARGQDDWPVTDVTWHDSQAYAEWKHKRLPTEAEWEFAARGADGRVYPWGNSFNPGWTNSVESRLGHAEPVGSHPKVGSPFGVLDMSGNVWQWCQDAYQPYEGRQPGFEIPVTAKAVRGGSFESDKYHVTTTTRNLDLAASHSNKIGFRCAKTP